MLLAVAAEFREVDHSAALNELDALALPLFGAASLPVGDRMRLLAAELGGAGGLRPGPAAPLDGLWLDRVLSTGRGHPALIAAVYVEVARRAGFEVALLSAPEGWFVGTRDGGSRVVLVDPAGGRLAEPAVEAPRLRRHCGHELAYAVLSGLATRFQAAGAAADARRAAGLRLLLPVDDDLRAKIRAELA
jgi:regulator of sirC expression with transglutaminase-like and TPR domain